MLTGAKAHDCKGTVASSTSIESSTTSLDLTGQNEVFSALQEVADEEDFYKRKY